MTTLSAAVMHVPGERDANVRSHILPGLRGAYRSTVVVDAEREGPWPTSRSAWRWGMVAGATHHLVVQDDVELCRDFIPTVLRMIAVHPEAVLSLYCLRKVIGEAVEAGERWVRCRDGVWGPALVMPRHLIGRFLAWERENVRPDFRHDDDRISMWTIVEDIPVWTPAPSIVAHGAFASLMGHGVGARRTPWFLRGSGLRVDWSQVGTMETGGRRSAHFQGIMDRWMYTKAT